MADVVKEINKTASQTLDVPCISCKRVTKHVVLASVDLSGEDLRYGIHFWTNHQIVECRGCETTTFRTCTGDTNDVEMDEDGDPYHPENITLFPNRSEGRTRLKGAHLFPVPTQLIYDETIKALNNSQPVLAGIGIRALVETVCKDKQAKGKDLNEQINALVALQVLTPDGAAILHKIRTLGNAAAHEVKPHTPEQLALAFEVCEHLLQGVYLLPEYAKATFK